MHSDGVDRGESGMNEQRLGELMLEIERTYAKTPNPNGSGMLRPPLPCDKRQTEPIYDERASIRHDIFNDICSNFGDGIAFDCVDVAREMPHIHRNAASNYLNRMVQEGYLTKLIYSNGKKPCGYIKSGKQIETYDLVKEA